MVQSAELMAVPTAAIRALRVVVVSAPTAAMQSDGLLKPAQNGLVALLHGLKRDLMLGQTVGAQAASSCMRLSGSSMDRILISSG